MHTIFAQKRTRSSHYAYSDISLFFALTFIFRFIATVVQLFYTAKIAVAASHIWYLRLQVYFYVVCRIICFFHYIYVSSLFVRWNSYIYSAVDLYRCVLLNYAHFILIFSNILMLILGYCFVLQIFIDIHVAVALSCSMFLISWYSHIPTLVAFPYLYPPVVLLALLS